MGRLWLVSRLEEAVEVVSSAGRTMRFLQAAGWSPQRLGWSRGGQHGRTRRLESWAREGIEGSGVHSQSHLEPPFRRGAILGNKGRWVHGARLDCWWLCRRWHLPEGKQPQINYGLCAARERPRPTSDQIECWSAATAPARGADQSM